MSERQSGEIVDFHMGAFGDSGDARVPGVAVIYGYDTTDTPRTPAEIFYADHRAYAHYGEAKEHEIPPDDPRILVLGIRATEQARLSRPEADIDELAPTTQSELVTV